MIKILRVSSISSISINKIQDMLIISRSSYEYSKFIFHNNKYFIQVNFNRDLTISISSNIKNLSFINNLEYTVKHYSLSLLSNFLYRWIKLFN